MASPATPKAVAMRMGPDTMNLLTLSNSVSCSSMAAVGVKFSSWVTVLFGIASCLSPIAPRKDQGLELLKRLRKKEIILLTSTKSGVQTLSSFF